MPDVVQQLRGLTPPTPVSDDDPYINLVEAILHRAVEDAQGRVAHAGNRAPLQIECEARAWLQDGRALADLVELCGLDPAPVLRRVRRLLAEDEERRGA